SGFKCLKGEQLCGQDRDDQRIVAHLPRQRCGFLIKNGHVQDRAIPTAGQIPMLFIRTNGAAPCPLLDCTFPSMI
ncbi:MAG: hypothetical protein LBJ41_05555, partial [Treponema sp.]|nr:hypothetical protein [Treponema sp.]